MPGLHMDTADQTFRTEAHNRFREREQPSLYVLLLN
jgi:hypothetical protein